MDMWQMMQDEGGSRMGTHGLLTVLERMNNVRLPQYNEDGTINRDQESFEGNVPQPSANTPVDLK